MQLYNLENHTFVSNGQGGNYKDYSKTRQSPSENCCGQKAKNGRNQKERLFQ